MTAITTTAIPLINTATVPGVERIEEVSVDGKPAMKIVFVDGVEATVARARMDKSGFDIWLPSDQSNMAASVMRRLTKKPCCLSSTNWLQKLSIRYRKSSDLRK